MVALLEMLMVRGLGVAGRLGRAAALYLFVNSVALKGARRAAIFFSLVPLFVLLLGWFALGEVRSILQFTGLIIVLIGFRLTQKQ